ncbi:MAG: hypothetical protein BWY79_00928 [Actinobacteria bacterium ADurb.Bin444]|nr:MAG: hypothetical protein BWY79_00928 [Actinobacteria bacterium ADurb.Bin444]
MYPSAMSCATSGTSLLVKRYVTQPVAPCADEGNTKDRLKNRNAINKSRTATAAIALVAGIRVIGDGSGNWTEDVVAMADPL